MLCSKYVLFSQVCDRDTLSLHCTGSKLGSNGCVPDKTRQLSHPMGKPTICIGENKDADQLRGNREADQRLCFRYTDSTIPLLPKYEISFF